MKVLRRKNLAKAIQLSLLISLPGLAAAQDAAPAPAAANPQATTLDTVTVTGSRIRQTDAVTAQPVFVLDREKLEATGVQTVGEILQQLTASGKALLAVLADEWLQQMLPDPLPIVTPCTPDRITLLKQLGQIAEGAVAEEHGELIEGLSSFAITLETYLGRYSIAIVGPTARLVTRREPFQQALHRCQQSVERAIGRRATHTS